MPLSLKLRVMPYFLLLKSNPCQNRAIYIYIIYSIIKLHHCDLVFIIDSCSARLSRKNTESALTQFELQFIFGIPVHSQYFPILCHLKPQFQLQTAKHKRETVKGYCSLNAAPTLH
jgi:hypothetical protein